MFGQFDLMYMSYRLAELAYPTLYPRPALRQPPIRQSSAERASITEIIAKT